MFKSKITGSILILLMLFFSCSIVSSQVKGWSDKTPEEKTQKIVNSLTLKLDLTKDQATSIYDIVLPAIKQVESLKQTSSGNSDYTSSVDKIIVQADSQIQSILNAEQYQKLEDWKKEMMERYKNKIYNKNN